MAKHITGQQILGVILGRVRADELLRRLVSHVRELCRRCDEECEAAEREGRERERSGRSGTYEQALQRAWAKAGALGKELPQLRRAAREAFDALMALPPARRRAAVEDGPRGEAAAFLGELLIEESRRHLPAEPRQAQELAALAAAAVDQGPPGLHGTEVRARALAWVGNSERILGRLNVADELLAQARLLLAGHGAGDALVQAELDSLEGSLRRDQRRLGEAARVLQRAAATYEGRGLEVEAARAFLKLGAVYREEGRLQEALTVTLRVPDLLRGHEELRLELMAEHNLGVLLFELGDYRGSQEVLERARPLYDRYADAWTQLRRQWLVASLQRALGEVWEAEEGFRLVRSRFHAEGMAYDTALVTLDLAGLYLEMGRTVEVKALAEEIVPLFQGQGVHREAAVALRLFVEAVQQDRLTAAFLQQLYAYLEQARNRPGLPFRPTA